MALNISLSRDTRQSYDKPFIKKSFEFGCLRFQSISVFKYIGGNISFHQTQARDTDYCLKPFFQEATTEL